MDWLPSIIVMHDDICIFSSTPEEHDWYLMKVMQTTAQHGIVFNSSKCQIRQPQIAFYSAMFSAKGMQPDPSKIQALQDLPTPKSPTKLQSFLGLINYLQPFISGLSNKMLFLQEQTAELDWNPLTDAAFQCLKTWICQTLLIPTLAYYDWSKPVVVQTYARKYGLGVAQIQCCRPIAFACKILTNVETHYSNIERDCLSECFGLEKFYTYLYVRHVTIENSHKTLEMIQHKPIHAAHPRLQCMLLHMQKYHYTIHYKPSNNMILADCLSWFP